MSVPLATLPGVNINFSGPAQPPSLDHPLLDQLQRDWVDSASIEDLVTAYLWMREARFIADLRGQWVEHLDDIVTHIGRCERRKEAAPEGRAHLGRRPANESPSACWSSAAAFEDELWKERVDAENAEWELDEAWDEVGELLAARLREQVEPGRPRVPSPLVDLVPILEGLSASQDRLRAAVERDREVCHELAKSDAWLMVFERSSSSVSLAEIDALSPQAFEALVAELMEWDDMTLERRRGGAGDLGADAIGVTADALRVVAQVKHVRRRHATIDSGVIQTVNGTARPVHRADIVVVVTNGTFTRPARDLAKSQGIFLVDWKALRRWATLGEPLLDVIGYGYAPAVEQDATDRSHPPGQCA